MAAQLDPGLQDKLDELEKELEEGDITEKGYQKRRTQLLSSFFGPGAQPGIIDPRTGLGIQPQQQTEPDHGSNDGHRAAALAALGGRDSDPTSPTSPSQRPASPFGQRPGSGYASPAEVSPAGLLRPGGPLAEHRPTMRAHDSLFLSPAPEPSTRTGTMVSGDYAFNPDQQDAYDNQAGYADQGPYQDQYQDQYQPQYDSRSGTMLDSTGYFSGFTGQQAFDHGPAPPSRGDDYPPHPHRYSSGEAFSPTAAMAPPLLTANDLPPPEGLEYQMPLEPREVPFAIHDPHDANTPMSKFDNIAAVLRHRGRTASKMPAYWVLDNRGKEMASITWDKLASRAEKVAQVIRDLRGVVLSHRTIMHQMACMSAIVSTLPGNGPGDTFNRHLRDKNGKLIGAGAASETLLSYLDPRQGIGMILGVLLTVYGGHTTVWVDSKVAEVPGLYANLITKYKATILVADYPGLKRAAYNYQQDPMTTRNFKKGMEPNFQTVKICLIDTLTVDSEFHEVLADRWLKPLRNPRAREVVAPMLCLPEHGGMIISIRDWLGGEERMGCPLKLELGSDVDSDTEEKEVKPTPSNGFGSLLGGATTATEQKSKNDLSSVLLDREALKTNEVVVVAIGDEVNKRVSDPATVRVGAFGYPIPDATLAVVDPETGLLSSPHSVGEIWVDSPSLSGGFWALPKHTEQIFHARPYKFEPGEPTPTAVEPEFLRTGLLGTVIEGKVFILGLYEDRIRQKVEWVEHGTELAEHRYFFVQHIVVSIVKNVPKIYDCSAFDVFVNDEHLPIVVLESPAASTAPLASGQPPRQLDTPLLESLAERCIDVLMQEHHLRLYCVMITAPNSLPRVLKNGRREIGNMLCRREFDLGNLPCVHVKFGVEHAVLNLPIGVDPMGGIWSNLASESRADILMPTDKQYSGIDRREVVIDDRTSTPLNNFSCITDLIQWRVARQPEELSYCTIDGRSREGKGITWKKFDTKVAAVALYLKNKVKVLPGDHIIMMYTHSEEFVFAIHACINLGAVVIPMAPLDQNRLNEDVPAFLHVVSDYNVKACLVNQDVDHLIKMKNVASHIKQSAQILKIPIPNYFNTTKPPKQNSGLRDLGITMQPAWIQPGYPVIIWTYWTPDQRRISVQLAINTVYSHVLNPMVASRSYMCIEPIELWLDTKALRRGLIIPVDPDSEPKPLMIQDSGMVPVSTQIAIVNPESRMLCHDGVYGEIWVDSEACVKSFYGSKDAFDAERFDGRTLDGDPSIPYVRTGDLGFLHNVSRPIGPGGAQVDMQVLFVLGNIGETFEINGLSHFPMDIEYSVERCHRSIVPSGCAVFQAGGLVVVLVEVARKSYLASIVPVIVNAILNEHQIIVDIVAFVGKGEFPRSRLGEKQRGKILAGWVTRKLRTMAQFAIRDMDPSEMGGESGTADSADPNRASVVSQRSSGVPAAGASSLRNVEHAPQILEQEEFEQQMGHIASMPPAEMPGDQRQAYAATQSSSDSQTARGQPSLSGSGHAGQYGSGDYAQYGEEVPPAVAPKPGAHGGVGPPQLRLPGVDGRESMELWRKGNEGPTDEEDWTRDAIMHMNLANDMDRRQ
ncbi:hypothetical protein BN1708_002220 [Verticillium longisporum]|uniref:DMAP1-binding domain-containing protein n=1 Tax=Verticillium longisporum TaxID=100787 RepID=A0A0G4KLF0_VERLO|nr:hypothetical protein BN1708_002220 [Verticillium longisporum]